MQQNSKTKTNTNPNPNRYRRRCPDTNARIQKFIHYMAIATFAIADLCDSGLSPLALGSGQCLLYRLGSGLGTLGLVLVLVFLCPKNSKKTGAISVHNLRI